MWCVSFVWLIVVCDDWSVLEEVCRLGVLKSRWRLLELRCDFESTNGVYG